MLAFDQCGRFGKSIAYEAARRRTEIEAGGHAD
jgi:hypothetical protein